MIALLALAAMQPLPPDAPTVEEARRAIQEPLRHARQHSGGFVMINVTTTTTPEAEHLPTGARCRFWYGGAEIRPVWLDDRAISCTSAGGWVYLTVSIYDLRGPRRVQDWGIAPLLRAGPVTLETLAATLTAASATSWDGAGAVAPAQRRQIRSPAGRQLDLISFAIAGPGGAPRGTRGMQYKADRLLIIDGWLFEVSAIGPVHYRRALDGYVDSGVQRLVESLEAAARLPTFRAAN